MAKWILEDDCLAPERIIKVDYKGPNPFRIYQSIPSLLRAIFDVRGKDVWEREFRWDNTGAMRDFLFRFIVVKGYDMWTKAWAEVIVQGKNNPDPNKDGEVTVMLTAKLRTGFDEDNMWNSSPIYKSLRWIYLRTLYNDVRRNLIEECRIKVTDLRNAIQKSLGISAEAVMS